MNAFKKAILENDKLPEFSIGEAVYKGRQPVYQPVALAGGVVEWVKVEKGIPFVKVEK